MKDIEEIKKITRHILNKHNIKKAGIFGSAARGDTIINDLDLLVRIDQKISLFDFIGIKQELEDELGMNVDLVEYGSIKPSLEKEILRDEIPVI